MKRSVSSIHPLLNRPSLVTVSVCLLYERLWQAKDFPVDAPSPVIIAVRQARVGDFQGKNLSSIGSTKTYINDPEIGEANALR